MGQIANRKTIILEVSQRARLSAKTVKALLFHMENNAEWTVEQWTYMQTVT